MTKTPPKFAPQNPANPGLPDSVFGVLKDTSENHKRPSLTAMVTGVLLPAMGRLLDKLKRGAPAYDVKVERDGFTLIGKPDHIDEFSDIVREAAEQAGEEFVVFTTSDGHQGYSQMFVMPLDAVDAR